MQHSTPRIAGLLLLAALLLAATLTAAAQSKTGSSTITPTHQAGATGPDFNALYTLRLSNTSPTTQTYTLDQENTNGWTVWVWPCSPTLGPQETITLTARLHPPQDAPLNSAHTLTITANTSGEHLAASFTTTVTRPAWWWWPGTCNLPPVTWPDGCPDLPSIEPPPEPIPPPCVVGAEVEQISRDTTKLYIRLHHPEFGWPPQRPETVMLTRYFGIWRVGDLGGQTSCAKDEAPLAWAALQLLDGNMSALDIYSTPLPLPLLEMLADLGGWQLHRMYLPLITQGPTHHDPFGAVPAPSMASNRPQSGE